MDRPRGRQRRSLTDTNNLATTDKKKVVKTYTPIASLHACIARGSYRPHHKKALVDGHSRSVVHLSN
jgi:hypothetical protein